MKKTASLAALALALLLALCPVVRADVIALPPEEPVNVETPEPETPAVGTESPAVSAETPQPVDGAFTPMAVVFALLAVALVLVAGAVILAVGLRRRRRCPKP